MVQKNSNKSVLPDLPGQCLNILIAHDMIPHTRLQSSPVMIALNEFLAGTQLDLEQALQQPCAFTEAAGTELGNTLKLWKITELDGSL